MLKSFIFILIGVIFQVVNIQDSFKDSQSITVYKNGASQTYYKEDFQEILEVFEKMILGSREMPAFGVSVDKLTREELKHGLWIEFNFSKTMDYGMPFESLLIKVEKDYSGFNIIRKYNGLYEGRCFYLDLEGTMEELHNFLTDKKTT